MAIRKTQDIPNLDKKIEEKYRKACILKLQYVGEQCIRDARLTGSYTDRTGNLRSSIGYVIVDRGQVVFMSNFEPVEVRRVVNGKVIVSVGREGAKDGRQYVSSLAKEFPSGIALIVVAGMNYASYVQRRGYNVTASAELIAEQLISKMKLNAKVEHPQ